MKNDRIFEEIDKVIQEERFSSDDPFFYTRLSSRIEKTSPVLKNLYYQRIAVTLMFFCGITAGIFAGLKVSKLSKDNTAIRNEQIMLYSEENNLNQIVSSGNGDIFLIK